VSVLNAQDFTYVLSGLDHPEDIVWDSGTQTLYAGSENGVLYRGRLDGTWSPLISLGEGQLLLGLAVDDRGRVYVCNAGGRRLEVIDPTVRTASVLSTGCAERAMITPNYPAFEASGRLLLSDSGTWGSNNGVIYAITEGGRTQVWDSRLPCFTNGIALAPEGNWLYVVESIASRVSRIEIRSDGSAGQIEPVWSVADTVPDGLAFDVAGRLYISCYTPDSIFVVEPDGSSELFAHDWSGQTLQAPTNIAFIGEGLELLATANLCGWHVNVTTRIPDVGLPLPRPALI